ncbi:alpha/beta fold hydrolase [Sphingomonas astaxanthinifaciens]|uniref:Alpha/beta hydrolase n=1 Tax=Sphingomonas astaxanthinifaciens DSM 22298 TaxID=1123267 RepID=A0ABQ5Z7F6_9SPHN|nr:alpha/beta hydrolase [Sphingomonas astaxanthinifaciens]GLR48719.1 alpha/beta hydrolase [Sphingomonas astaxanthinifaciens DSM 22298]
MRNWAIAGVSLVGGLLGAGLYSQRAARRAEELAPMDGRLVDVGSGITLHVTEDGSGPPLLLIHGLGAQLRSFAKAMVDDLARDHRVIRVDRPGSGYSPPLPSRSQRLDDQADAMAALIDTLGLEKPVVVGHSLGGALALKIAERHGDKLGGLALIAPATQPVRSVPDVFRGLMVPLSVAPLVARTIAVPLALATKDKALATVFAPETVPDDYLTAGGGLLAMRPGNVEAACADLQMARQDAEDMTSRYAAFTLPVAILFGRGDSLLSPAEHGELTVSQIPGATLTLVEGGHMLPFTQPVETAAWVRQVAKAA